MHFIYLFYDVCPALHCAMSQSSSSFCFKYPVIGVLLLRVVQLRGNVIDCGAVQQLFSAWVARLRYSASKIYTVYKIMTKSGYAQNEI